LPGVAVVGVDDEAVAGLGAVLLAFFAGVLAVVGETGFWVVAVDFAGVVAGLVDADEEAAFNFFGTLFTGAAVVPGASGVLGVFAVD